ncbi:MAG: hypothetical protein ACI8ZV_002490 [Chitinophagales bacterium]|jgi:hypothetical protein
MHFFRDFGVTDCMLLDKAGAVVEALLSRSTKTGRKKITVFRGTLQVRLD